MRHMSDDYTLSPLEHEIRIAHARIIYTRIQEGTIFNPYAREATIDFLALMPIETLTDAKEKITYYLQKHPDFSKLLDLIHIKEDEERTREVIEQMHHHLRQNDVESALAVAQKK